MTSDPILSFDRLSVEFQTADGPRRVLDDISLDVDEGTIVGVVGESGSGKSTLIATALGLLPNNARIAAGRVIACGRDVAEPRGRIAGANLGFVGQNPMGALNPVLAIGQQLVDLQHRRADLSRREKRERAVDWLGRVGIANPRERLDAFPFELSGGTLQRIAIAAALMTEPRILFADEPTTALDVTVEAQIMRLILEARDTYGLAVVLVTHHLALVSGICSKVAVLYGGMVVEEAPSSILFDHPRHPYTGALIDCDPAHVRPEGPRRRLPVIGGRPPSPSERSEACRFAPRCPAATETCHHTRPPETADGARRVACHFPLAAPRTQTAAARLESSP